MTHDETSPYCTITTSYFYTYVVNDSFWKSLKVYQPKIAGQNDNHSISKFTYVVSS